MVIRRRNILDTSDLLQKMSELGIGIKKEGNTIFWSGPYGGRMNPNSTLAGKRSV
jgi:hypothetical protein